MAAEDLDFASTDRATSPSAGLLRSQVGHRKEDYTERPNLI